MNLKENQKKSKLTAFLNNKSKKRTIKNKKIDSGKNEKEGRRQFYLISLILLYFVRILKIIFLRRWPKRSSLPWT